MKMEKPKKIRRAFSPSEVLKIRTQALPFEGEWEEAFGQPGRCGTWIIWGPSGNGKSSFVMQLAKYLCQFGRVAYNSLEESTGYSMQRALIRHKMYEVDKQLIVIDRESIEELSERLRRQRAPDFVIIDSFQYSGLNYASYKALKEAHPDKLLIFVSHADGLYPDGRAARKVAYDADVKILVQGFRAFCKGRFIAKPGAYFTVWADGAKTYWGEQEADESQEAPESPEDETTEEDESQEEIETTL
jgi:hypothetical protein